MPKRFDRRRLRQVVLILTATLASAIATAAPALAYVTPDKWMW